MSWIGAKEVYIYYWGQNEGGGQGWGWIREYESKGVETVAGCGKSVSSERVQADRMFIVLFCLFYFVLFCSVCCTLPHFTVLCVCCTALYSTTLKLSCAPQHYSQWTTLHGTALHHTLLHWTASSCTTLNCTAMYIIALHFIILQRAKLYRTLHRAALLLPWNWICNIEQHSTTLNSTAQHSTQLISHNELASEHATYPHSIMSAQYLHPPPCFGTHTGRSDNRCCVRVPSLVAHLHIPFKKKT